jgi:hypothetical protein
MWSQAVASALVWIVVTGYSLTSAFGHAALNRFDTAGQRTVETAAYKDLRADLKRAQDQLGWIPQHRPAQTVQSAIDGAKNQRAWTTTKGCTEVAGKFNRDFCQQYHTLSAEFASAQQAVKLDERISEISTKLMLSSAGTVMTEADPQAAVLAKLAGIFFPDLKVEDVQTALTIFVAILLEVGSGLGMYVAFSTWRLYEQQAPSVPLWAATPSGAVGSATAPAPAVALEVVEPVVAATPMAAKARLGANDNRSAPAKMLVPESDVQRYYRETIDSAEAEEWVTSTTLYEVYSRWCDQQRREKLTLPAFGKEFAELGVKKGKIDGRVRYFGIKLKSEWEHEEDKKPPERIAQAA